MPHLFVILIFLLLCTFLLATAAAPAAAPSPQPFTLEARNIDSPDYRATWGPYLVTVAALSQAEQCFRIADKSGRVLREIRAPFIDRVFYPDLSGRGRGEELCVLTHPSNNTLSDIKMYGFTRQRRLRNILAMPCGFDRLRDLDHDGRPELIADDPAPLEWAAGLSHGGCPSVMVVLGWDGQRYTIRNRRFPAVARGKARFYRGQFLEALSAWARPDAEVSQDAILSPAFGYWANLATLGEERGASRWLLPKLPPVLRQNFLDSLPEVRERLDHVRKDITVDQRRVIVASPP